MAVRRGGLHHEIRLNRFLYCTISNSFGTTTSKAISLTLQKIIVV